MRRSRMLLVLFAWLACDIIVSPMTAAEPVQDAGLRRELLRRMQTDQDARKTAMRLFATLPSADLDSLKPEDHALLTRLQDVDLQNTVRMKEIVERFGWPGNTLVGRDGAHAAWLLVQHADRDVPFQQHCLKLLEQAVKDGEAAGADFAYLTDRVRVARNEKQLYGTQFEAANGQFVPLPLEDEAHVDERRKAVGLEPLADYLKAAAAAYAPELKPQP